MSNGGKGMSDTSQLAGSSLRTLALNLIASVVSLAVGFGLGEIVVRVAFHRTVDFDMEM